MRRIDFDDTFAFPFPLWDSGSLHCNGLHGNWR